MYVYRFINSNNEIIYIGKAKDLKNRLNSHDHLPDTCYSEIDRIEYIVCLNTDESSIYERYLINKISPKYNTQYDNNSEFSFELPEKEWKVYNKLEEVKVNKVSKEDYDKMSLKERIKYHKSIGDVVFKVDNKCIFYKKEILEENRDRYLEVYNNCYNYKDITEIFKILCSFDNKSIITYRNKEYKPKRLFYFDGMLYTSTKEVKYNIMKNNTIIIYDIKYSRIIIYFYDDYYVEMKFKSSVEDIRDMINNTQEYITNEVLQDLDYKVCIDLYYWKDIISWWKEDFNQNRKQVKGGINE